MYRVANLRSPFVLAVSQDIAMKGLIFFLLALDRPPDARKKL